MFPAHGIHGSGAGLLVVLGAFVLLWALARREKAAAGSADQDDVDPDDGHPADPPESAAP